MRSRWGAALVCAVAVSLFFSATASAERPLPSWYTSALAQQVHNAGAVGVRVGEEVTMQVDTRRSRWSAPCRT